MLNPEAKQQNYQLTQTAIASASDAWNTCMSGGQDFGRVLLVLAHENLVILIAQRPWLTRLSGLQC